MLVHMATSWLNKLPQTAAKSENLESGDSGIQFCCKCA